jgi:hypothetical protein
VIAGLLLVAVAAADAPRTADVALLPADGAVAGCTRSGAFEVYTAAELYSLIDGGAELFLELGFVRATVQRYTFASQEISLELYRMRDPVAALGVYLSKCGKETPDPTLALRHTVGRVQLQLVKGDLYVAATGDKAGDGLRAALLGLAAVAAEPVEGAREDLLAALPHTSLVPGSARVIRGPFALEALVTLGEGDVLLLQANHVTALAGEYPDPDGVRHILVQADYPSAEAAARALANLAANLDPYLTVVGRHPDSLELRDETGRSRSVRRDGARLSIRVEVGSGR